MANIVYGKFGRAISFNKNKWSVIGGDIEAPTLLLRMAMEKPNDTFYIISSNDFSKWEGSVKFPNIISLADGYSIKYDTYTYIYDKIERLGIKMDYGIFYNGITGQNNIPDGDFLKQNGTVGPVKVLFFAERYVAPIFYYLNTSKLPYMLLVPDPRYFPLQAVDLWNVPKKVLSQFNSVETWRTRERATRKEHFWEVEQIYSGLENVCLMGWKKMPKEMVNKPRSRKFTIILNEGKFIAKPRGPMLEEYLLNQFKDEEDIEVYGKWEEPYLSMPQFKGGKSLSDLFPTLIDTRYTLCIPIQPGWVTAKVTEMIHYGIIPFLHEYYDEQKNLDVPEFLRCKNAEDFKTKVQYLEDNPQIREQLQMKLWELYPEKGYYDGSIFIEKIYESAKEITQND